jgi:hypothetical protein
VFDHSVLSQSPIMSIMQDRDGNIWMTAFAGGLVKYDPSFYRPREDEPLLASGVLDLAVQPDGSVYLATKDGGLVRYDGRAFSLVGAETGLPTAGTTGLAVGPDQSLWVINWKTLSRRDGDRFVPEIEESEPILSAKITKAGSICVATERAVSCRRGTETRRLSRGVELPDATIINFLEDSKGTIWVATQGGLSRLSNGVARTFTKKDGLYADAVSRGLLEGPDGNILFSGNRSGFFTIQGGSRRRFEQAIRSGGVQDRTEPPGSGWPGLAQRVGKRALRLRRQGRQTSWRGLRRVPRGHHSDGRG